MVIGSSGGGTGLNRPVHRAGISPSFNVQHHLVSVQPTQWAFVLRVISCLFSCCHAQRHLDLGGLKKILSRFNKKARPEMALLETGTDLTNSTAAIRAVDHVGQCGSRPAKCERGHRSHGAGKTPCFFNCFYGVLSKNRKASVRFRRPGQCVKRFARPLCAVQRGHVPNVPVYVACVSGRWPARGKIPSLRLRRGNTKTVMPLGVVVCSMAPPPSEANVRPRTTRSHSWSA